MEKVIVPFDLNQNSFKPEEESMESLFDYYDAEYSKGFCPQGFVEDNMLQFPKTCLSNQNESVIDNIKIEDINNNLEIDEKIYFINSPKENLDTKNNTPDLLKKMKRKRMKKLLVQIIKNKNVEENVLKKLIMDKCMINSREIIL